MNLAQNKAGEGWFFSSLWTLSAGDARRLFESVAGAEVEPFVSGSRRSQLAVVPFQRSRMTTTAPPWCTKTSAICRSLTETLWLSWSFIFKGTQPLSGFKVFLHSSCADMHLKEMMKRSCDVSAHYKSGQRFHVNQYCIAHAVCVTDSESFNPPPPSPKPSQSCRCYRNSDGRR